MVSKYFRDIYKQIVSRVKEERRFIQILAGPRQVGKTTLVRQVMDSCGMGVHYASADEPTLRDRSWLAQQWDIARAGCSGAGGSGFLLVIDEVQKVSEWSETVKRLWDEDTAGGIDLKVILLGSSPLLMQQGLTESLAGRFETIPVMHWSFKEMRDCFGMGLDKYIYFGGYPGAAGLIGDENRWMRYIQDSLVETTISRDILLLRRVDKPVLLRRLFSLGCEYSGQVLSYQKMTGQLQDAGNTVTLAHYLELLGGAGLVSGLGKYAGQKHRKRASSPKLLCMNTALISALSGISFNQAVEDRQYWGRLTESAVGAHLLNDSKGKGINVYYWLERNSEVDFVLEKGRDVAAIEVKSSKKDCRPRGLERFCREFDVKRKLLVGGQGIPIEAFLSQPVEFFAF